MQDLKSDQERLAQVFEDWLIIVRDEFDDIVHWIETGSGKSYRDFYERSNKTWIELQKIDNMVFTLESAYKKYFPQGDATAFSEFASIVKIIGYTGKRQEIPSLFEINKVYEKTLAAYSKLHDAIYYTKQFPKSAGTIEGFRFVNSRALYNGNDLMLPAIGYSFEVFEKLVNANGAIVPYKEFPGESINTATEDLKALISRLRQILKQQQVPFVIQSIRGAGYRLSPSRTL